MPANARPRGWRESVCSIVLLPLDVRLHVTRWVTLSTYPIRSRSSYADQRAHRAARSPRRTKFVRRPRGMIRRTGIITISAPFLPRGCSFHELLGDRLCHHRGGLFLNFLRGCREGFGHGRLCRNLRLRDRRSGGNDRNFPDPNRCGRRIGGGYRDALDCCLGLYQPIENAIAKTK
jgi:hypothetical protein